MRRASCIVLTRPGKSTGKDTEVYLVKRSPELRFLGGFHAFAGGGVEEAHVVFGVPRRVDRHQAGGAEVEGHAKTSGIGTPG